MKVTVELSDKQEAFLRKLIADTAMFPHILTMEEALLECVKMAMFDEGEVTAAQEGCDGPVGGGAISFARG